MKTHAHPKGRGDAVDAARLAAELTRQVEGEVRFGSGDRALYSTDSSNYRQIPIGVVVPKTKEDIVKTFEICRKYGAPITSRGAGTSLAGQCCNVAVIIDTSKNLRRIHELDPERRFARVEPGVVLDQIRDTAAEHHLTFGSDTSTHAWATIGGSIGNNACGVHSHLSGRTSDNIKELEIITYDGLRLRVGATSDDEFHRIIAEGGRRAEIYQSLRDLRDRYADLIREHFPKIPRRVSGYNLDDLLPENGFHVGRALSGTEGTCVGYLEATMHLVHRPPYRTLVVLGYDDIFAAGDHVPAVLEYGVIALEGMDSILVGNLQKKRLHPAEDFALLPEGQGFLLAEFGGGTREEANEQAEKMMRDFRGKFARGRMVCYEDKETQDRIFEIRESGLPATARLPELADTWEGWEDAAVHPDKLGAYLRDFRALTDRHGYSGALYGHFGQGCVHTRTDFGMKTADQVRRFRRFIEEASDLVVEYGGSFSGEHGDGQSKAEFLTKLYGPELVRAFGEFKAIWDPAGKMNPGKIVDPYRIEENLRYGKNYHPHEPETEFKYPEDKGSFSFAMERCVGVGKCRRTEEGTMCPSYMATREEKHSTRGRARLLFEMLQGDVIDRGWKEESVREALDLCLSCKACKSECPMQVDMATYKAEFNAHYFKNRLRPLPAYSMGLIHIWARLASRLPKVANFFTQAPLFSTMAKRLGGIAPQRQMPRFAETTFHEAFKPDPEPRPRGRVILWADTFNDHFHPEILHAAAEVLRSAGFQVEVPRARLCCGRPLYEFGMLDLARFKLQELLGELRSDIRAGVPVVGLEPSCVSTFRTELPDLFPHDTDAQRLAKQTFILSEFLINEVQDYQAPVLKRKALVHLHCHQRATMDLNAELELLTRMGVDHELLDSGCCGMAGAFGFEKEKYDVSVACAERVLLPAVREAAQDTLIVSNGFSCQQQIEQLDGRRALHIAQLLQMALREGPAGPDGPRPENHYLPAAPRPPGLVASLAVLTAGAAIGSAVLIPVIRRILRK
ncbi:MAG: FAD-binding and (Fe-S)-binding domain-containing protein [Akkermansiaceae bacterium]